MNKRLSLILLFVLAVAPVVAGAGDLVRGETRTDTPAINDDLCVSNLFQAGMVLQREKPIHIWGWAAPGEEVSVSFAGAQATATAADDRSWKVSLPAQAANTTPQTMSVKGKEKTLTLTDILIGDVWVLSGQSNMEFEIAKIDGGELEIVSANFPQIRHITIPQLDGPELRTSFPRQHKWSSWSRRHFRQGYWDVCTPETVRLLSGIGYIFARRIHLATQVPIGVIDVSRGGTTLETWTPDAVLRDIDTPEVKALLESWDKKVAEFDPQADLQARIKRHESWLEDMEKQNREVPENRKAPPSDLRPGPAMNHNRPGNCYASSLAPLEGLSVKGTIWHQGYNNALQPDGHIMYYQIFPKMIAAWREAFGDPEMPFGIISLCTAGDPQDQDNYVSKMMDEGIYIRAVQYQTYADMKKAGDKSIGFASSFDQRRSWYHPQIKIPVGERIAQWALDTQYGMRLPWEPPSVTEMKVEDGKIHLTLSTSVGPHNDGPMLGFAIAGEDGKWQPAKVEYFMKGRDGRNRPQYDKRILVLSSPLVPEPIHYRHAWGRNPEANLKSNGIPLPTLRSDNWTIPDMYNVYTGKELAGETLDRRERNDLKKALKEADLQRRLHEARQLIEQHAPAEAEATE